MMQTGVMKRKITIERKSVTSDPTYGTPVVTWVPLSFAPGSPQIAEQYWAEVQDVLPSRSEGVIQGLNIARNPTRLRMRWRNDIDSSMRVTIHGETDRVMQIIAGPAEIGGRKQMIEMMLERFSS